MVWSSEPGYRMPKFSVADCSEVVACGCLGKFLLEGLCVFNSLPCQRIAPNASDKHLLFAASACSLE